MSDEYNRKSAPQKAVLEIVKTGEWSKVQYIHKLECGHVEIRKRAASTKKLSCISCVKSDIVGEMLTTLSRPIVVDPPIEQEWIDEIAEDVAQTEQEIGFIRAGIASSLSLNPDAIDVVMENTEEGLQLSYVVIFLEPDAAMRLAYPKKNVFDIL